MFLLLKKDEILFERAYESFLPPPLRRQMVPCHSYLSPITFLINIKVNFLCKCFSEEKATPSEKFPLLLDFTSGLREIFQKF